MSYRIFYHRNVCWAFVRLQKSKQNEQKHIKNKKKIKLTFHFGIAQKMSGIQNVAHVKVIFEHENMYDLFKSHGLIVMRYYLK